ncbi:hypothetical protein [Peribacillus kribbensis]|uniref:hypothetical protein n=1 Tax=Peribacillus kribbensis TaxID=356658 RepID=UPI000408C4E5|nr:hypothetical protein [Peribacillus kribbensis]
MLAFPYKYAANNLFWNEDKLQPLIQRINERYVHSDTKEKIYCYMLRIFLEEIYNTVILDETGHDINGWRIDCKRLGINS